MKNIRNLKHIFIIILISLFVLFGLIVLFSRDFTNAINGLFIYRTTGGIWQDYIYKHDLTPSKDIIIINIDDRTLNETQATGDLKMLTMSKQIYADLVEKLEWAWVRWIAFDIIFQNSDPDQREFAKTLKKYKNIVLGASTWWGGDSCSTSNTDGNVTCEWFPQSIYASIPWGLIDVGGSKKWENTSEGAWAFVRITKSDIYTQETNRGTQTIAGSWKHSLGLPTELMSLSTELAKIDNPKILMRKEFRASSILNPYFWPPKSYKSISLIDVMNMTDSAELEKLFLWKYIFIGESGTLIHDSLTSPVTGTLMDGVESHAHFLDGILQDKMLDRISDSTLWIVTIFLLILTVFLYFYLPTLFSLIFAIVSLVATLWASRYIYDSHRLVIDIFPLFLSVFVISFPTTYIYRFFIVDREKRFIENAFGHYIDPKMVEMIDMEEVSLTLGGEERDLSVFFSDIAGFTTISEKLSPADLFYLMSSYLSRMTDILKTEWGTLDKYIGDAVMGFFGAPVAQADHAVRVCRTALAMRRALPEFNREIRERGIEEIDFRIGIATGDVLVGNIGSTDHFNYTVLGDTVNLASRLEATGKEYSVHAIISEWTRTRIGDTFELRELDTIAVKWKTEWIKIYELLGYKSDNIDRTIYDTYEAALVLYREQKYMEAGKLWETIQDKDAPSQIMMFRTIEIIKWNIRVENGVYHMTHK
jgi:class 3 adenylate cyclase